MLRNEEQISDQRRVALLTSFQLLSPGLKIRSTRYSNYGRITGELGHQAP